MTAQTDYSIYQDGAIHGAIADMQESEVVSKKAEGGDIGFGVAVSRGTNDGQAVIGGDDTYFGVTVRDLGIAPKTVGGTVIAYEEKSTMSVLRRGNIAIAIPSGGTQGDALNYVDATGVIDAGAPEAGETILKGATLENTVAAGKIGIVRLSGQI